MKQPNSQDPLDRDYARVLERLTSGIKEVLSDPKVSSTKRTTIVLSLIYATIIITAIVFTAPWYCYLLASLSFTICVYITRKH